MNRRLRILFCISDAGSAHRIAAQALGSEFEELGHQIEIIDLFEETDVAPFNTSSLSYALVSRNKTMEFINDLIFRFTNLAIIYPAFKKYLEIMLVKPIAEILEKHSPDIVITNHQPTAAAVEIVKSRSEEFQLDDFFLVGNVLELQDVHRAWVGSAMDLVISPTKLATRRIIDYGIPSARALGEFYPLRTSLATTNDRKEFLERENLKTNRPIILLTAGGMGAKMLRKFLQKLASSDKWQILVICGNQHKVYAELQMRYKDKQHVHIYGFRADMQDFLASSDLILTKAGATTVMELEYFAKPTIFIGVVGIHERGNLDFALQRPLTRFHPHPDNKLLKLVDELLDAQVNSSPNLLFTKLQTTELAKRILKEFNQEQAQTG